MKKEYITPAIIELELCPGENMMLEVSVINHKPSADDSWNQFSNEFTASDTEWDEEE